MQLLPIKIKEVLRPQVELIKGKSPFMISHRKINNRDFPVFSTLTKKAL